MGDYVTEYPDVPQHLRVTDALANGLVWTAWRDEEYERARKKRKREEKNAK